MESNQEVTVNATCSLNGVFVFGSKTATCCMHGGNNVCHEKDPCEYKIIAQPSEEKQS